MDHTELIRRALALTGRPNTYLEIGVRFGTTFRQITATTKIGIDPAFKSRRLRIAACFSRARSLLGTRSGELLFSATSDEFFTRHDALLRRLPPNVVFVDGLHTAEQSYRDTTNAVARLSPSGVVVLHDCNPGSEVLAAPSLEEARQHPRFSGKWNGEVWRTIVRLRSHRPDLRVCVLDCDEGLGIVAKAEPDSLLELDRRSVDALSYDDLSANRERLLNLRPPEYGLGLLRDVLAQAS